MSYKALLTIQFTLSSWLIETILGDKKKYIAHRPPDRLRAPLHYNNDQTVDTFLRQLVFYRNHVENLCHDIN